MAEQLQIQLDVYLKSLSNAKNVVDAWENGPTHANNQTYFMQQSDVLHANFTQNSLKLHANFSFSALLVDLLFAYLCRHIVVHLIIYCGNVSMLFSNDGKLPQSFLCIFLPSMKIVLDSVSFASLIHELM